MENFWEKVKKHPKRVVAVVVAVVGLAVAFGVPVTAEQRSAIGYAVTSFVSLIGM